MNLSDLAPLGVPEEVIACLVARGFQDLTQVQSTAVGAGLLHGQDLLICAPTSAGKSLVAELVVARHAGSGLTAYLVSHKALATQVHQVLSERYIHGGSPVFRVGLLTGDSDTVERDWRRFDVVVSTYEKFYASLIGDSKFHALLRAVVADEIQLLGEVGRGPTAELLLARLRFGQGAAARPQFVGLSATIPNSAMIGDWLESLPVVVETRWPPLEHEIWAPGVRIRFRDRESQPEKLRLEVEPGDLSAVVRQLVTEKLGPVAVMATQKNDAKNFALRISEGRSVDEAVPSSLVADFRGAAEDPASTAADCDALMRGVAIHHADLTQTQRRLVEDAMIAGHAEVVIATPTLIAGVNFPIRTVVYPKMVRFTDIGEQPIALGEYMNGAGRAGRLGFHERGTAIILAESLAQARTLQRYVMSDPEPVTSQLGGMSGEYRLLHLAGQQDSSTVSDLAVASSVTLFGYETGLKGNDKRIEAAADEMSRLLVNHIWARCWEIDGSSVALSAVGRAVASSGLEPILAMQVYALALQYHQDTADSVKPEQTIALLIELCCLNESREFLPFFSKFRSAWASLLRPKLKLFLQAAKSRPADPHHEVRLLAGLGHVLIATKAAPLEGPVAENMKTHRGERARLCDHLGRLVRAASNMLDAENGAAHERTISGLGVLADQLEYMVDARSVPIARMLDSSPVPNMGPVRIQKLASLVGGEVSAILSVTDAQLEGAVGKQLIGRVRTAALRYLRGLTKESSERQLRISEGYDGLRKLVEPLLRLSGVEFEPAVADALSALGWSVRLVPRLNGGRTPDIEGLTADHTPVLVECKTCQDLDGTVRSEEAFDFHGKVPSGFTGLLITVGRPTFSPWAIERAVRATSGLDSVRLVTVGAVAELLIALRSGEMALEETNAVLAGFRHVDVSRVRAEIGRGRHTAA